MNVCVISPGLPIPPVKGGAIETLIHETVRFYKDSSVFVFSEEANPGGRLSFSEDHVHYERLSVSPLFLRFEALLNRVARRGPFSWYDFLFIRRVMRRVHFSPDIIHVHNNFYYVPLLRKRFPKSRILLHLSNDFLFYYPYLYRKYVKVLDAVDRVVVLSSFLGDRITRHYEGCRGKIVQISGGFSPQRFRKLPEEDTRLQDARDRLGLKRGEKAVLFVGRICKEKGVEVLVRTFGRLREESKDVRLLVVGSAWYAEGKPTPYLRKIRALSDETKDAIIFTGFVPHEELNTLYNLAAVCVVPSLWDEPFGLVNLEAMAAGCPVIASRVGGIPDLVRDGETGLLVPPNDAAALYEKIKYLLTDETARQRLIANAMEEVGNRGGWQTVAARIEKVYKDMVKDGDFGS